MAVIEVRQAQREGARLVIGISGVSGSGKTVTALMLAYGLANYDPSKVGFIDAENKRGSLNADVFQKADPPSKVPFLIGDLYAPFSPQRYMDAIQVFQQAKVEVLIIDSASHEWEGPGGCQDIAGEFNKYWNKAKKEHKRFVTAALQCDMHVIMCFRAREKVDMRREKIDGEMKTVYDDAGLQPITEKNMMFEMTASLMMHDRGQRQDVLKPVAELVNILGRGKGYITPQDGKAIRDWVDGGKQLDPVVEKFRNRLQSNTEGGEKHIEECWAKTSPVVQAALGEGFHNQILLSARAYDKLKADAEAASAAQEATDQGDKSPPTDTAAAITAAAKRGTKKAADQATAAVVAETKAEPAVAAQAEPAAPAKVADAPKAVVKEPEAKQAVESKPAPAVKPPAVALEEPMF